VLLRDKSSPPLGLVGDVRGEKRTERQASIGPVLAATTSVLTKLPRLDVLVGRSLAMCAHPYAAWRRYSIRGRLVVVLAYTGAGYAVVLGVLLVSF
jgi:hypothetical protein